jgi:hypothetical protein
MADVNWDKIAWDEPTQSTPVEDIRKVTAAAIVHALQQQGGQAAWDEPNEGGDEEAQAKARYQEEQEKVAAAMAHAIQQQTTAPLSDSSRLVVGDHVRVKDGTFAGFEGPVREVLEAKNQVRVQLSAFRHPATLDLEYWQVERIPPPDSVATGKAEQRPLPEEVKKVVQWADRHGCLEDTVPGHAEWAQREGVFWEVAKSVQVTEEQVTALPLAEVHPANKGPYLLDEQGNIRTLEATAHPESLHIQVGNLEVVAEGKPGAAGIPFCGNSRILVDGKPFPVKSLVLRGNVDGLWTVEMEFYLRQPKE